VGAEITMTSKKRFSLVATALAVATSVLLPAAPAQAYHSQKAQLSREIKDTKARLSRALANDAEMRKILNELDEARAEVQRIDQQISSTQHRLTVLETKRTERLDTINDRAAALYMMGPINSVEAAASADSLDEFVARAAAVDFIASFDRRILEDLAAIRYETRIGRITLREARAQAAARRAEVSSNVSEIAAWQAAKQEARDRIRNKIDRYRDMIRALEAEQARIEGIISGRGSYSGSVYTGAASSLGFAWPFRGNITSPYGPRWGGFHTGLDIDCRTGNRIGASRGGRVIASEWGGGYGYMVIVDHGDGFSTLYAHMSRLLVSRGESVGRGSVVGLCGSTGNSTGDHLHFEIRYNGSHRNPRPYLP
jgi:murein DD-endopeptidase MepM/ murein hydrolase activator NlpD